MLEAVPQHRHKPVHVAGVVEGRAELPHRVDPVGVLEPRPCLRLGLPDEINQSIDKQPRFRVVNVRALRVAARRGQKRRLDVGLKPLFIRRVNSHEIHLEPIFYIDNFM